MSVVIPSINCPPKDTSEVERQVKLAAKFATWVHLDIADGVFTFHKSWNEPENWPANLTLGLEIHCMTEKPGRIIADWLDAAPVQRFIVHEETLTPEIFDELQVIVRTRGRSLMLALNPETKAEKLKPYLKHALQFQVLAVHPGLSGQKFLPLTLKKIAWIRHHIPDAIIEVDGGMNPETARAARRAGADILVSHEYIFSSKNPAAAYAELARL